MVLESFPITHAIVTPTLPVVADLALLGLVVGGGAILVAKGIQKVRHEVGEAFRI